VKPNIYVDVMENNILQGKWRPFTAVSQYADATDVELAVSQGAKTIDAVLDSILDPNNRSIIMNPMSVFTSVSTCKSDGPDLFAIQNFAYTAKINAKGAAEKAILMTKPKGADDTCQSEDAALSAKKKNW